MEKLSKPLHSLRGQAVLNGRLISAYRLLIVLLALSAFTKVAFAEEKRLSHAAALDSLTAKDLGAVVDYLADDSFEGREAGSRGGRAAGDYLLGQMPQLRLQPAGDDNTYVQNFGAGFRNLLGIVEGSDPKLKKQVILVGAHYDHVGYGHRYDSYGPIGYIHNGADDNASGDSGVMLLARALTFLAERPKRSVLFVFWDAEEKGLVGSRYWTAHPTLPLQRLVFALNLDMIGRLRSDHVIVVGTRMGYGLRRLLSEQNESGNLMVEFPWEIKANADHYSFLERQIPALTIHTGEHEDYHRPSDKAAKINRDGMRRVARFAFQTLYELSNSAELTGYRDAARSEAKGSEKSLLDGAPKPPDRLGATYQTLEQGAPGAVLTGIDPGSPADKAALRQGDRVVHFGGQAIRNRADLARLVETSQNPVEVQVRRGGVRDLVQAKLELDGNPMRIGITWCVDDAEPGTVLLSYVLPESPAAKAGLVVGDRIYQVAGRNFPDEQQFAERIRHHNSGPIEFSVERDGRIRRVTVRFAAEELKRAA
jgi:hypothetical protein